MTDKRLSEYKNEELLQEDPNVLMELFQKEYTCQVPENADDLRQAAMMLGRLTNAYSFVMQLSIQAKRAIREAKRAKKSKDEIDDAIDRKAVIDGFVDIISMQYKAISRIVTIRQQENEELKMTDGR